MASPVSSDEGEIRDTGIEKATTSLLALDGAGVDPKDRNRSRSRASKSPSFENGSSTRDTRPVERSHSSYSNRAPRGSKRSREEDHYDRRHADPRRFKAHYEDRPVDFRRRERVSYEDLDNGTAHLPDLRYDDRERYPDKRPRTRSRSRSRCRSPYRAPAGDSRRERAGQNQKERNKYDGYRQSERSGSYGFEKQSSRSFVDQSVSKRGEGPVPTDASKQEAKSAKGSPQPHSESYINGTNAEQSGLNSQDASDDVVESEPLDEAALIEQRRKRREAIKAKYGRSATPLLVQALHIEDKSAPGSPGKKEQGEDDTQSTRSVSPALSTPGTPLEPQDEASPPEFAITSDQDLANKNSDLTAAAEEDGPSAADYDPTVDMREDQRRDDERHHDDISSAAYEEIQPSVEQDILLAASAAPTQEKAKKPKDEFDMFAEDDDDDMFAEDSPVKARAKDVVATDKESSIAVQIPEAKEFDIGMLDNWDDPEGYYKIILGELLNGRYHVQTKLGRGMFSDVIRATDVATKKLVAIKLIRNNDTMRKAGLKELGILQKLNEADPDDKKHLIRLERHFEHKGHLCMVFENLSINLREVLKKFGRDVGINLKAVRAYAQQMFLGLSLMRKCNVLHADLKPDNILVNESRNMLKICDLGSASDATENEITPYLVSRFYRAPEIILGIPYDFAIDVWSIGCTLYELFTGKILFTGRTNNQMLRSIMDCRGKFTTKMLKRAQFAHMHFDEMANFRSVEQDKLTGKDTVKILNFAKPSRDLRTRLLNASKGMTDVEMKELNLFADLLDRCLALNPEKRCTPNEALKHPFISRVVAK